LILKGEIFLGANFCYGSWKKDIVQKIKDYRRSPFSSMSVKPQAQALDEIHDLAIYVANQVSICACDHCSKVYRDAKVEYLMMKAREKEERELLI
jgi:hypothetical protein